MTIFNGARSAHRCTISFWRQDGNVICNGSALYIDLIRWYSACTARYLATRHGRRDWHGTNWSFRPSNGRIIFGRSRWTDAASAAEIGNLQNGLASQTAWQDAAWLCIPPALNSNCSNGLIMNQFRTQFEIASSSLIAKALCYIASHNYYAAFVNGIRSDKYVLGAFSQFEYTAYYDTMSCAHLISVGSNVVGIMHLGQRAVQREQHPHGTAHGETDGGCHLRQCQTMRLRSNNESWFQGYGPISFNDIYVGEWYDATHETKGWMRPGFAQSGWVAANIVEDPVLGHLNPRW